MRQSLDLLTLVKVSSYSVVMGGYFKDIYLDDSGMTWLIMSPFQ